MTDEDRKKALTWLEVKGNVHAQNLKEMLDWPRLPIPPTPALLAAMGIPDADSVYQRLLDFLTKTKEVWRVSVDGGSPQEFATRAEAVDAVRNAFIAGAQRTSIEVVKVSA